MWIGDDGNTGSKRAIRGRLIALGAAVGLVLTASIGCGLDGDGGWRSSRSEAPVVQRESHRVQANPEPGGGPEPGRVGEAGSPTDPGYARGRYIIPTLVVLLMLGALAFALFTSKFDSEAKA